MRRLVPITIAALVTAVLLLAGCGGSTRVPTAETVVGSLPKTTTQAAPSLPDGNANAGKQVFASAGCGGCHTLKAANASGTVGPNLDQLQPDQATVEHQVVNGGGAMPAFKGTLTPEQITNVAAYVSTVAGKSS